MEVVIRPIEHESRTDKFRIYPLGDVHIGHRGCNEDAFREYVAKIEEDDHAYWIGMGDYLDCVQRGDKRYDPAEQAKWVRILDTIDIVAAQRDRFLKLTEPIHYKCLGLLTGNHEDLIRRRYERDVYRELVGSIKTKAPWPPEKSGPMKGHTKIGLGYEAIMRITFRRIAGKTHKGANIDIFLHHGAGGGRLKGAKALNLQRAAWAFNVDAVIMGHTHDELIEPVNKIGLSNKGRLYNRRVVALACGTFLATHCEDGAAYVERALYWPGSVGTGHLELWPHRNLHNTSALDDRERVRAIS